MDFFIGDRAMLNAFGNDDELAFTHDSFVIAEFHPQCAFDHEK
jgi:hypothetical protein